MNTIEIKKYEVVVSGDESIVIPKTQFKVFADALLKGKNAKGIFVSMDINKDNVHFYTNDMMIEVVVNKSKLIDTVSMM